MDLMQNPAFTTFALCSAILVLKGCLSGTFTAVTRLKAKRFMNPEDAKVFGGGSEAAPAEVPAVARALRVQRNDAENLPAFFAIGLIFVLVGASATAAAAYFWTFTIARILHTLCYMFELQPWRALCFAAATLCLIGMSVQVLMAVL